MTQLYTYNMELLIETFSNLWKTKFPGAKLPDTTFFESKKAVEIAIRNRTGTINKLKLELAKEEFLLLYLKDILNNSNIWEATSNNDDIEDEEKDCMPEIPVNTGHEGTYDVPSTLFKDRSRLGSRKIKSTSLDDGVKTIHLVKESDDLSNGGSLSSDRKSLSVDSGNIRSRLSYHSSGSSDDDEHDYMNAEEFVKPIITKPLPKPPMQKQAEVSEPYSSRVRGEKQNVGSSEIYENFHMKPTLEKLKISSTGDDDDDVIRKDDESVFESTNNNNQVVRRAGKRSGSQDRQGSTFDDDLDITCNTTPKELVLNISEGSSLDVDDDDSPIYANVKDIHMNIKHGDEDDTHHQDDEPHYREMTQIEIAKLNVSDEDDLDDFDSDDGVAGGGTPDSQRKNTCTAANELPRSRSADCLGKGDEKHKALNKVDQLEEEKEKSVAKRNRKYLVMNLLDTEKCYNDCLDMLSKFMKPLKISAQSTQPILSEADFNMIFHQADELVILHREFMCKLEPLVQNWNEEKLIGEAFRTIMLSFDLYSSYIGNYKHATETVLKCRNANDQFRQIMDNDIRIPSLKEPLKLDALLFKPIDRMTQYSVLLNDLLKYTPPEHPDHPIIVEISGELFKLFEQVNVDSSKKKRQQRTFLKETAVVELVESERRARNLILFNDVLISAKKKTSGDYICKWYTALKDLSLKRFPNSERNPEVPTCRTECDRIRASIANLRQEFRKEQPLAQHIVAGDATSPFVKRHTSRQQGVRASTRVLEKMKKKIDEQEQLLQLLTPIIPIYVYSITGKTYTLLVRNQEDRVAWVEALKPRIKKATMRQDGPVHLSSLELQQAFETVTKMQNLPSRSSTMSKDGKLLHQVISVDRPISMDLASLDDYKELLTGFLFVNIHNAKGFNKNSDIYIMLETSCYGHFYKKGKSKPARGSEPQWDEEFNIEVEACQFLRLTCYNKLRLMGDDVSGKVSIDLTRETLSDNKIHKINVSLDKGVVTMNLSLCFSMTSDGIKKAPSKLEEGVFGMPIKMVAKREKSDIPVVVISCIKEVEKRGMDEVGIYRLSGVASEIRDLKKLFNEDTQMAVLTLAEIDVHAIAGLLKLYFRDLPESLFTSKLHHKFVNGLNITGPEEKELYMVDTLHELPRTNLMTCLYLLHHLRRVVLLEDTNKMGINNLATVFGPTLLRAPTSGDARDSCNIGSFDIGALDVMSQVGVFRYILSLRSNTRTHLPDDDLELWRRLDADKAAQLEMGATQEFLI